MSNVLFNIKACCILSAFGYQLHQVNDNNLFHQLTLSWLSMSADVRVQLEGMQAFRGEFVFPKTFCVSAESLSFWWFGAVASKPHAFSIEWMNTNNTFPLNRHIYELSTGENFLIHPPLLLFNFSRETHHVFDFSSSVFHSIFIVAVLLLFVLFVIFVQNSRKKVKRVYRREKRGIFISISTFSFVYLCLVFVLLGAGVKFIIKLMVQGETFSGSRGN